MKATAAGYNVVLSGICVIFLRFDLEKSYIYCKIACIEM